MLAWTGSYFLVNGIRKEFNKLRMTSPPPSPLTGSPLSRIWKNLTHPFRSTYWSEGGQQVTLKSIVKSFRTGLPPPLVLTLNTATAATMLVYGMEYFVFWGTRKRESGRGWCNNDYLPLNPSVCPIFFMATPPKSVSHHLIDSVSQLRLFPRYLFPQFLSGIFHPFITLCYPNRNQWTHSSSSNSTSKYPLTCMTWLSYYK